VIPFVPLPEIKQFFDALDAASQRGLIWGDIPGRYQYVSYALPPVPPTPTDPMQQAFFEQVCMMAYHNMEAANTRAYETIARARGQSSQPTGQVAVYMEQGLTQVEAEMLIQQQMSQSTP
jgi:hypothetical protein